MAELSKDRRFSHGPPHGGKTRNGNTIEICEICGQLMEMDPESGEYYCPICFFTEHDA